MNNKKLRLEDWVDQLVSFGEHAFSLEKVRLAFAHNSEEATRLSLVL